MGVAKATAEGLKSIGSSLSQPGGYEAARLRVAEEYIKNFLQYAAQAKTVIVPANVNDPAALITTAMATWDALSGTNQKKTN